MLNWGFTKREKAFILLIISFLLVGAGIRFYKKQYVFSENAGHLNLKAIDSLRQEFLVRSQEIKEPSRNQVQRKPGSKQVVELIVNLNSATLDELMKLPKVGPVLGKRILGYREKHGKFRSTKELMKVRGIGLKTYQKIQSFITVN